IRHTRSNRVRPAGAGPAPEQVDAADTVIKLSMGQGDTGGRNAAGGVLDYLLRVTENATADGEIQSAELERRVGVAAVSDGASVTGVGVAVHELADGIV